MSEHFRPPARRPSINRGAAVFCNYQLQTGDWNPSVCDKLFNREAVLLQQGGHRLARVPTQVRVVERSAGLVVPATAQQLEPVAPKHHVGYRYDKIAARF